MKADIQLQEHRQWKLKLLQEQSAPNAPPTTPNPITKVIVSKCSMSLATN